uniref:UPF0271 protein n=1 Tax=Hirondellea gigas TaxID=1518452 RepID=A0A6A7G7E3_9CRUS
MALPKFIRRLTIDPALTTHREIIINCDMGEGFGLYKCGDDEGLMKYITHANVACGFHASDPSIMRSTVQLAKKYGVKVGAHPSLPDRQGFGRREMALEPKELTDMVIYQVGALVGFLKAEGMELSHIKPHGSLYGMCSRDEKLMEALCDAFEVFDRVPMFGLGGTMHEMVCHRRNIPFVSEFYSDLEYGEDGMLVITRCHEAVDSDEAASRVRRALEEGKVRLTTGVDAMLKADAICVHSDTPGAVKVAMAVQEVVRKFNETRLADKDVDE